MIKAFLRMVFVMGLGALPSIADAKTTTINSQNVVGFKIGMTKAQIDRTRKDVTYGEDINGGCLLAEVKNQPITMMIENNIVARIYFTDETYITSKGIHFGSTEKAARAAYGKALKIETHHYDERGHYLSLPLGKGLWMRFETDGKLINNFSIGKKPAIDYVEGCL